MVLKQGHKKCYLTHSKYRYIYFLDEYEFTNQVPEVHPLPKDGSIVSVVHQSPMSTECQDRGEFIREKYIQPPAD